MKLHIKKLIFCFTILFSVKQYSQHHSSINAEVNTEYKTLNVIQHLTYYNQTKDTLKSIVLNDWNNAYSGKDTHLAKRFSDEFERAFLLAKEHERGSTKIISIIYENSEFLLWERPKKNQDLIEVPLTKKILPDQKVKFTLTYQIKIPSDIFTSYGFNKDGDIILKNWFLAPSRYEKNNFVKYSNVNLDDIPNALSDFDLNLKIPLNYSVISDLDFDNKTTDDFYSTYHLNGKKRLDFYLQLQLTNNFISYKNNHLEVITNLKENKLDETQKEAIINKIVSFTTKHIGKYPFNKIVVSQNDYEKNPFYGLNQLPTFISPFNEDFLFEIKFLKTYLNNYLKNTLNLNPRYENWIYDAIQIYTMMKYIDEFHPDSKMMGSLSKYKLIRGYNLVSLDFNGQYRYFYTLMARKNLDQPLNTPKDRLIKFNEKIASKYRAGLSLKYLDSYLDGDIIQQSINQFYKKNIDRQSSEAEFRNILQEKDTKNLDWFFDKIINSRELIDYKFDDVLSTNDSIYFSVKNKTKTEVPIPIYGIKNNKIIFKKWYDHIKPDSIYKLERLDADKIVLNYEKIVPEINQRNNWRSLKDNRIVNRPIKFNFLKDLEDPYYNQILYVPTLNYNFYDGMLIGFRFHNKTILNKPFVFDANPSYATNSNTISGSASFAVNQNYRNGRLFNINYYMSGQYFQYAEDAYYKLFNPSVVFRFRSNDLRDNRKEMFVIREIVVHRDKSNLVTDETTENYSVFNLKYSNSRTEVTNHLNFNSDFQLAGSFGKISSEFQYRKLFENNRQFNFRLFAGSFIYKKTDSDFFNYSLDRPTDYMFEHGYIGRSETTGILSQQFINAEGGFKSKFSNNSANSWLFSSNLSFSIWNWIELYGDVGVFKNKGSNENFVYDSGIRLNLVTDYFELYFPLYSKNGWEISQENYNEKIRFTITLSPNTLINLFTRKWF